MAGTEVTYERVAVFERQGWMNQLAEAVNQAARAAAANEAIVARVREVEQQLEDADRVRQQVQQELTETRASHGQAAHERDALGRQVETLSALLEKQQSVYAELHGKWAAGLEEQNRLRELVRVHGGDPEQPAEEQTPKGDGEIWVDRDDEPEAPSGGDNGPEPGAAGTVR